MSRSDLSLDLTESTEEMMENKRDSMDCTSVMSVSTADSMANTLGWKENTWDSMENIEEKMESKMD